MTAMKPSRIPSRPWLSAISAIAAAVMFAAMSSAHAADCVKNTEVCVEGPATRDIGALFNDERRGWHDRIAGSRVIRE